MIISQISTATGRFTLAYSMAPMAWNGAGRECPSAMPATMHRATHRVR
jgi:hypothetical protein